MEMAWRILRIAVILMLLTACGSGGSSSDNEATKQTAPPTGGAPSGAQGSGTSSAATPTPSFTAPKTIQASIGSDVPMGTARDITAILSLAGAADPSGTLPLPALLEGAEALVIATQGSVIKLMAFATTDVVLDGRSTAAALVRMALPTPTPINISSADLNNAIRSTASYPELLSAVNTQLQSNASPVGAREVEPLATRVAREVFQALAPQPSQAATITLEGRALPWTIADVGFREKAWFDAEGTSIYFHNQTAVAWEVSVTPGASSSTEIFEMVPPRIEPLIVFDPTVRPSRTPLYPAEPRFKLTASQNSKEVVKHNTVLVFAKVFESLAGVATGMTTGRSTELGQCYLAMAERFVNDNLPDLGTHRTWDEFNNYLLSVAEWSDTSNTNINAATITTTITSVVATCAVADIEKEQILKFLLANPYIRALVLTYNAAKFLRTSFTTLETLGHWQKYFGQRHEAYFCRYQGSEIPCRFTLIVDPVEATIRKGETVAIRDRLTDANGSESLGLLNVPATWTSDRPDVATVTQLGVVEGINAGTTRITVTRTLDPNVPASQIQESAVVTITEAGPAPPASGPCTVPRFDRITFHYTGDNGDPRTSFVATPRLHVACMSPPVILETSKGGRAPTTREIHPGELAFPTALGTVELQGESYITIPGDPPATFSYTFILADGTRLTRSATFLP